MYAIVDIAGQQFKVQKNQRVLVHRLEAIEGSQIEFDRVLLVDNDGKIAVGKPLVDGYKVAAKVLGHVRGEKVIVFKKKRRKGYAVKNGHRQDLSEILVQAILAKGETFKAEETEVKKPKTKAVTKAEPADETETVAEKKAPAKKTAAKTTKKK
ncbi:MAG: 50S ribosomal protein L21 [Bacteroidia bacterium]|nr:50S ribosomal protein L21 [Bacteroidia bacterium]